MQPLAGQAEEVWLEQCVAKAWDMPLERSVKADILTGLTLLSGLVYNPQTITAIVSKEYLMGSGLFRIKTRTWHTFC